jgi:pyruvate carboxylase subunit B
MKYLVTIGERTLEVVVDGTEVLVDGQPMRAELEAVPGSPTCRLVLDGRATTLAVAGREDGVWRLVEAGAIRELLVEDERTRHIRMLAGAGKGAESGGVLKAPMPGLVVRIAVVEGQTVQAGASLLVLEAMKMENELKAAAPGVVTGIRAAPGQAVEKGQVLLELGPLP